MLRHAALAAATLVLLAATARATICTANVGSAPVACAVHVPRRLHAELTRDAYGVPHLRMGQADPHNGDQAPLFRSFTYKPMVLR